MSEMVKSAADYEYVTGANVDNAHPHGDLDRILIDGTIMPLRGDNVVRGEDIAFLMEFAMQRLKMIRRAIYMKGGTNVSPKETECVDYWPFATTLSCEFANTIAAAAFGDAENGLFGIFSDLASKVRFPTKDIQVFYKKAPVLLSFSFPKGLLSYMLGPLSLDPKELTKKADLSGSSSSILKSSVEKYFTWVDADKYCKYRKAFFYQYFSILGGFYSSDYAVYDLVVGTEGSYVNSDSSKMHIGAHRYRYENEEKFELYCYPKEGVPLLTLVCDHATSVSALIILRVDIDINIDDDGDYEYSTDRSQYDLVLRGDFEKTGDNTFVLKAKTMASRDFIKSIINQCAPQWYSQSYGVQAHLSFLDVCVFPVIEFDSHTMY